MILSTRKQILYRLLKNQFSDEPYLQKKSQQVLFRISKDLNTFKYAMQIA